MSTTIVNETSALEVVEGTSVSTSENGLFEKALCAAIKLPGIKIDRASFLKKELSKRFDGEVVKKAIETNPAQAGISVKELEKIAAACINYETTKVSALSAAAGVGGFKVMAATIPLDFAQFFGHVIRILQKLVYLYGWQEIFCGKKDTLDELDSETMNQLILFIGVMFGVKAAVGAINKVAAAAAVQVPNALLRQALTKGAIYPIVKKIAQAIGVNMTKAIFAKGVGKAIPVVGAVASGGITLALFLPMAKRLQKHLISLPMASVDFYQTPHDNEIVDLDFSDIIVESIAVDEIDLFDDSIFDNIS